MPVSFNQFPADWRMPLYWVEVDSSQAGLPIQTSPALLVGQMFSPTSGVQDIPIPIGSKSHAAALYGNGSMLERMFNTFFENNFSEEVWGLGLADPSAGIGANGSIAIATPPTDSGTLSVYITDQRVQIAVHIADTTVEIAANLAAAINATANLPVTATANASAVDLACKWVGSTGNDIYLGANFFGAFGGEVYPPGLTLTFTPMSGGTAAPDMTAGIANLGDLPFDYVSMPYTDTESLLMWDNEYGFTDTGRWGWMRQLYGMIFTARRDTYSNLIIWGMDQNWAVISTMGIEPTAPSPVYLWTAAYGAMGGRAFLNDPARPLQTLILTGILPAPLHQRFDLLEMNALAGNGVATQTVEKGQIYPMIMRETTGWQYNSYGQSDDAYELLTTLATLMTLLRSQRQAITSKFPRSKLADDGTPFGIGQAIVTPKIIKAELVAEYAIDEFNGLVENMAAFKANLIVERDPNNPNRANVLYPPDLINQLRIFAVLAQFRLQYDRGIDTVVASQIGPGGAP
jgi:phage tail sheath gpL-like